MTESGRIHFEVRSVAIEGVDYFYLYDKIADKPIKLNNVVALVADADRAAARAVSWNDTIRYGTRGCTVCAGEEH